MKDNVYKYESIAKQLNNLTYSDYFHRLMEIAKSCFEWINLPNGIKEEWIENYLFSEGSCLFFKDKLRGFMITKYTEHGRLNYYDEPTTVKPYALDYIGPVLENNKECVIIKNNSSLRPTYITIMLYAHKLTNIERTIDVNIEAQKTPVIVECSEKEKLSMKNFMKQRNDNEPLIFTTDKNNLNGIKIHDLKAPPVFKDLELQKHMIWNECMTFLGINNANQDKRERLVDDEVQANNEQVESCRDVMLSKRQSACNMINELFGLTGNQKVIVRRRIQETPKLDDSEPPKGSEGGDEDE